MLFIVTVIVLLIVLCAATKIKPTLIFFGAVMALLLYGAIGLDDLFAGLSNSALITVVLMLLISDALRRLGLISFLFNQALEKVQNLTKLIASTALSVGLFSSVFNNVPLVSVSIPAFKRWSRLRGIPAGKILLPLSYLSILGGACTLIGTSTNLVADALLRDLGLQPLSFFDFTMVGAMMFFMGAVYLMFLAPHILKNKTEQESISSKTFVLEFSIEPESPLINKSVEDAKLRTLPGVFLAEIIRGKQQLVAVSPKEILRVGDKLIFVGDVDGFLEVQAIKGLSLPKKLDLSKGDNNLSELVVASNSKLDGVLVKHSDFRSRYGGAIVAVHRNGEQLSGRIGDIRLQAGDLLLVLSANDFANRIKNNPAFVLVSNNRQQATSGSNLRSWMLLTLLVLAIAVPIFGRFGIQYGLLIYLLLLLTAYRKDIGDLRSSIDYNLILLMVFGLAIGKAIALGFAQHPEWIETLSLNQWLNGVGAMFLVFLFCNALSSVITGKAVLAIALPLLAACHVQEPLLNFQNVVMVVVFACSVSFVSPFGYQTNLMVYAVGHYQFTDYVKLGLPLTLAYALTCALYYG